MTDMTEFKDNELTEQIIAEAAEAAVNSMETEYEDTPPSAEQAIENELEVLRSEVALLKEALSKKTAEADMIKGQLGEFSELFPDVVPEDIPEEVWSNTAKVGSLAAAYALYHRRTQLQQDRVRELNKKNAALSTGKVGVDAAKEYFTPSEVRAMSREQIHDNYSKILDSMKRWN